MNKTMWLGFFFFVSLVLLLFGSLYVTNIRWSKPLKLKFDFLQVEGLKVGDQIRVQGFRVGKVDSIELRDYGVRVVGHMDEAVKVYDDYEIFVESFTLLGGNHISIHRGTPGRPVVPDHTVLKGGAKPSGFDQIGRVLSENRDLIRDMLQSIKTTADETGALVKAIRTGEGAIPRLLTDPTIIDSMVKTLDEVRQLVEKANRGTGTLGKLINDPSLYDELKASLVEIRGTATAARTMIDKVSTGQGTLGKLINDPAVAENFEKLMENLRKSSDDLQKLIEGVTQGKGTIGALFQDDTLSKKAEKVLDSADEVLGRAARSRVIVGGDYREFGDSETSTTKLFLRLVPDETKFFQAGVAFMSLRASGQTIVFEDQIEENDDQLKAVGEIFAYYKIPWFGANHLAIRGGLMEGKPGGGLDLDFKIGEWPVTTAFEIRDAYGHVEDEDIDENVRGPMTRALIKAPLWAPDGDEWWKLVLHSFKVTAGASRLQDDPEFFVGFGGELEDKDLRTLVVLLGLGQ
jgi:phospholipid/cholesterol/gamma-HCH transport system substrate-binding protein